MVRSQERNAPRWPECSKVGQVLDHAQKDVLAEVLQIDRRHTLAVEPADDQRTIQVRQVLPGIRFAGLSAEQQALPGLVHDPDFTVGATGELHPFCRFLTDSCKVFRRRLFLIPVGDRVNATTLTFPPAHALKLECGLLDSTRRQRVGSRNFFT